MAAACSSAGDADSAATPAPTSAATSTTTLAPTTLAPTSTTTTTSSTSTTTTTTTTTVGQLTATGLAPFGIAGAGASNPTSDPDEPGITLTHPAAEVGLIGFHQSAHDGSKQIETFEVGTPILTLESRERDTGLRTAADIAVPENTPIVSPVTGRVKRAGSYVLYCDFDDNFAVIEPDERPGWEVKVLHIVDVQVRAGDRVVAGETLLAPSARVLPFESQIDEFTPEPSWPHVHVEVIDPSVPDRPTGPGCP